MCRHDHKLQNTADEATRDAHTRRDDREGRADAAVTRREFAASAITAACVMGVGRSAWAGETTGAMPYRTLGRTGEKVSLVGLGGYHLGKQADEQESIRIIRTAIDQGITFMDNCWDYNDGASEIRMGKALRDGYRQKVFLMTKVDGRDRKTAPQRSSMSPCAGCKPTISISYSFMKSFACRIRTASLDRTARWRPFLEAKQAGKIRYIGFTGHKSPEIHLKMLETAFAQPFTFDAVQMPLNVMDAHYDSFEKRVLPVLLKHQIGVLGMKPMGDHFILESQTATPVECLHYPMNLPTSVVITGCDSLPILEQALNAARSFRPMSDTQVSELLARTANAAHAGQYERYKTTHHFDGTFHNPQWLGG